MSQPDKGITAAGALAFPGSVFTHVLRLSAQVAEPLRGYTMQQFILKELATRLDTRGAGVLALVAVCSARTPGQRVRSLRAVSHWATPLFDVWPEQESWWYGAGSLAAMALTSAQPLVENDRQRLLQHLPQPMAERCEYAAACAIRSGEKIAGSLLTLCRKRWLFTPAHLALIQLASYLLAVALSTQEWYDPTEIALCHLPPSTLQVGIVADYHARVRETLNRAHQADLALMLHEAEEVTWQECEEELLALSLPVKPDRQG